MLSVVAEVAQTWNFRMYLWLGAMLLAMLVLFLAAIAVFAGNERHQRDIHS